MFKRSTLLRRLPSCAIRCLHLPAVIMRWCITLILCFILGIHHHLSAICSCSVANLDLLTFKSFVAFCVCKMCSIGTCASSHFPIFFLPQLQSRDKTLFSRTLVVSSQVSSEWICSTVFPCH